MKQTTSAADKAARMNAEFTQAFANTGPLVSPQDEKITRLDNSDE